MATMQVIGIALCAAGIASLTWGLFDLLKVINSHYKHTPVK